MELETQRLLLRPYTAEDFGAFRALVADGELCRMAGFPAAMDGAAARKMFDELTGPGYAHAIVCKADGEAAGYLEIRPFEEEDERLKGLRGFGLSYAMSAAYRRRGLTAEALRAAIDALFAREDCDFINAGFFAFNDASRQLQEKLGFQYFFTHTLRRDGQEIETIENLMYNPRR